MFDTLIQRERNSVEQIILSGVAGILNDARVSAALMRFPDAFAELAAGRKGLIYDPKIWRELEGRGPYDIAEVINDDTDVERLVSALLLSGTVRYANELH